MLGGGGGGFLNNRCATYAGRIDSLESIPGLLKSLKSRALVYSEKKVERQVKVLIKFVFSFYVPAISFRRYHSKFSCWNIFPQNRRKQCMYILSDPCPLKATHSHCLYDFTLGRGGSPIEGIGATNGGGGGNSSQEGSKIPTWLTVSPVYEYINIRVLCLYSSFVNGGSYIRGRYWSANDRRHLFVTPW